MNFKRQNILGIILIVFLILILINGWYSYIPSYSQVNQVQSLKIAPNPSELQSTPAPSLLIVNLYIKLIGAIKSGNSTLASKILDQLNYVNYPSNLKIIFERMNNILSQINQQFMQLNDSLNEAIFYVKISDLQSAITVLNSVNSTLASVNSTLNELNLAYSLVSNSLGDASALLAKYLGDLNDVYLKYLQEYRDLVNFINEITSGVLNGKIIPTSLSLNANTTIAYVGSEILINGRLITGDGKGLGNQKVSVFLENMLLKNFTTSQDGSFSGIVRIPYFYKNSTFIFASYFPTGNYSQKYSPSVSNKIELTLIFYKPLLNVYAPHVIYPAKSFQIVGYISLNSNPLSNITLVLQIFNKIYKAKTNIEGKFNFTVLVPENQPQGNITFTLQTFAQGLIAPVFYTSKITVERSIIEISINYPKLTFTGTYIVISGKIISNGTPLANALIQIYGYGINSYSLTGGNGTFEIYVSPSFLIPIGNWELTIYVQPKEPWISPIKQDLSIFVFNPLEVILPLSIISMSILIRINRQERPQALSREKEERVETYEEFDVSDVYWQATLFVSQVTGKIPKKSQTIREYLKDVKDILKGYEYYEKISFDHERKVYGLGLSEEEIKNDIKLFNKLREIYGK